MPSYSPSSAREWTAGPEIAETAAPADGGSDLVRLGGAPTSKRKRQLVRRGPDRSQKLRNVFQLALFALNLWIGTEFYFFVRYFETGGRSAWAPRPPGVEGWLPIASLMNLKATVLTGELPRIMPAGMFLLVAFLGISLLFRKAFCSWLCPVGTLSEWLWWVGQRLFGKSLALPRWLDLPLRSLKYILLGLFLYAVGGMSVAAIRAFLDSPYGVIADVKMLDFFRHAGTTAVGVLALLVLLSIPIQNFWCRYLCPYGALLGLVSGLSPSRIRRDPDVCVDCAKCAEACPALLPVDRLASVRSLECTGCLACVAVCPAKGALEMKVGGRRLPAWALAAGVAFLFLGIVAAAKLTGHWQTELPPGVYFDLVPRAAEFQHP